MNDDSLPCQCTGDSTSGKATATGTSFPLADAEASAVGHEWEPLTTASPMGEFTIQDVCVTGLMLRFMKSGYFTEQEEYETPAPGSVLALSMAEMSKFTGRCRSELTLYRR